MIFIPFAALVIGFGVVYALNWGIPPTYVPYFAIAILAGLDSIFGGFRAQLEERFNEAVFVSGFFFNIGLAAALAYAGDRLAVDLYLAVTVALGIRIFNNLGRIRRILVVHGPEHQPAPPPAAPPEES